MVPAAFLGTIALCLLAAESKPLASKTANGPMSARQDDLIGLWKFVGCDGNQQSQIKQAFNDARIILAVGAEQVDFNSAAALEYWGPPQYTQPYRDRIINNYVRAVADHGAVGDWWYDRYIEIHCDDLAPRNGCFFRKPDGSQGQAAAYMFNSGGFNGNTYPIMNFCPGYFSVLKPHADVVARMKAGTLDRFSTLDMRSQASTFLHEMMHISKQSGENRFIGDPAIVDNIIRLPNNQPVQIYKPALAKYLAKTGPNGADLASKNNDNYAYYALAIFLQKQFGDYPQKPLAYDPNSGNFVDDDPLDESNLVNAGTETYVPGPTNAASLYPPDYISQYGGGSSPSTSTPTPTPTFTPSPIESPACQNNAASGVPPKLSAQNAVITPRDLLYRLRQVICTNTCGNPDGIPAIDVKTYSSGTDCEVAVALPNNVEAWIYRGSPSTGTEWQQCWDSTENIINKCINNDPNTGWWNGPDYGQFYQVGFRPLNGQGSKHDAFDGNHYLDAWEPPIKPPPGGPRID